MTSSQTGKHVHWIDNDAILNACRRFVEHLKLYIQNVINSQNDEVYLENCQISLNELNSLTDCSELKQAFEQTVKLANKCEKNQLLQHQTLIAQLITRTILLS